MSIISRRRFLGALAVSGATLAASRETPRLTSLTCRR